MHSEFLSTMTSCGIECKEPIIADGEIHRFDVGHKGNKSGWYVCHGEWGAFGVWGKIDPVKWTLVDARKLSSEELKKLQDNITKAKIARDNEVEKNYEQTAKKAEKDWNKLLETGRSPYLDKKLVKPYGIKYGNKAIAIPMRDIDGKLWNYEKVPHDGGVKKGLYHGRRKGLFHVIGDLDNSAKVFVAEGYSTGATVYEATSVTTVVVFTAGNLEIVIASIRLKYPNIIITIAADNDQWKKENTGKIKAEEAAKKHNCDVILPSFSKDLIDKLCKENAKMPTDFNDLHVLCGLGLVKEQLLNKQKLPFGFILKDSGLFYHTKKEDSPLEWICSHIDVVCYTRDSSNENWGRLIRFKDLDNHLHERSIPMEIISGDCNELYGLLLSLGLRITTKKTIRNKLPDYLQSINLDKRATCTSRIGWYNDYFILPDGAIPPTDKIYLQSDNSNYLGFRTAGTLEEWQDNVATPCKGNSRLIFSLSCAFAAPLLPLLNAESGGFNLKGSSSIGKSTALSVSASVWGSDKYIEQWKTTGNALEAVAEAHNHTLLCLDELGLVDGKEAGEIAYMLANGSGKNRMKAKGGLRKKLEWNLLFLSTGEISIADKINEAGKKAQAGMMARMADIPADANKGHKLFDTVHGFNDGNTLAQHLKGSSSKYYGTAIREFLPHLPAIKDKLPAIVKKITDDFFEKYVGIAADGQVQRVAHRFILVAAAGELAIELGILPYTKNEALEAAGICFEAWLESRGSSGSYESDEAIKQVKAFFESHHSSRFAPIGDEFSHDSTEKIINQAGYKKKVSEGGFEFYVFTEIFNKDICKGYDHQMVKKHLAECGLLLRDTAGKYTKSIRIPALNATKRMMCFTPLILTEGS